MGNKLGRRRHVVDEKYTKPQGLYQHKDIDHKKLRKLILDSKLAPCYPGDEECSAFDLEECPICFLYYPSLNRSRCCMKGICTECFLQMKPPHSTRPTQCPFCKTPNYAVEYRGVKTKEEKGLEQVEEQKVIEAKIRRRQQELQEDEERMLKRQDISSSSRIVATGEVEYRDISSSSVAVPSFSFHPQHDDIVPSQDLHGTPSFGHHSRSRQNRENEFDLDLEEIMVMEAIWLSIQDHGARRVEAGSDISLDQAFVPEHHYRSDMIAQVESSPSGGLACAIAAMAEHQHIGNGDSSASAAGNETVYNMSPNSGGSSFGDGRVMGSYLPDNWIEVSPSSGRALPREDGNWSMDHGSAVAEAGTSYASSEATLEVGSNLALNDGVGNHFQPAMAGPITPESFEEHMMLDMTVSLAESQGRPSSLELSWH